VQVRVFGEDGDALARAGADVGALRALEDEVAEAVASLPRGGSIDAHVHLGRDADGPALDPESLLADLERWAIEAAVCFPANEPGGDKQFASANAAIIAAADAAPGRVIPFCRVDPTQPGALDAVARASAAGARGLKLHPSLQAFAPNDPAHYPLYEAVAAAGVPIIFHSGQTGIGAGLPGGRGIKLRYSDPMLVDDVAADFPSVTVVLAHPSVPWQDAAISMATHKPNVYIDLSGWSPKYFPPQLVRAANGMLKRKVLFGSDYPVLTPDRWLDDFAKLDLKPDVRPLILKDNALRVLGLG
jgi:hypothetical protein